jgi:plasmid maintenance system antidote protein VapI
VENLNKEIKRVLVEKNLKPSWLAHKMQVSRTYVYDLLNEKRRWNEEMIDRACEALSISVEFKEVG